MPTSLVPEPEQHGGTRHNCRRYKPKYGISRNRERDPFFTDGSPMVRISHCGIHLMPAVLYGNSTRIRPEHHTVTSLGSA